MRPPDKIKRAATLIADIQLLHPGIRASSLFRALETEINELAETIEREDARPMPCGHAVRHLRLSEDGRGFCIVCDIERR